MNNKNLLSVFVLLILITGLTITVSTIRHTQDIRERASTDKGLQSNNFQPNSTSNNVTLTVGSDPYSGPNDSIPPVVSLNNLPNNTSIKANAPFTISVSSHDNLAVSKVEFLVNGGIICTDLSAPYSCIWHVPASTNTKYVFTVRAFDHTGNVNSKSTVVTAL